METMEMEISVNVDILYSYLFAINIILSNEMYLFRLITFLELMVT